MSYVFDEATRYKAARWVPTVTAEKNWQALRLVGLMFTSTPSMSLSTMLAFFGESFPTNADLFSIQTTVVTVESPNSMSIALQIAVESVNNSVGPDGISPTLAVYGAVPFLGLLRDRPSLSTYQRVIAEKMRPRPLQSTLLLAKFVTPFALVISQL